MFWWNAAASYTYQHATQLCWHVAYLCDHDRLCFNTFVQNQVYNMGKLNVLASANILYARCNVFLQDDYVKMLLIVNMQINYVDNLACETNKGHVNVIV